MATASKKPELVVIVGPTASGKSELAFRLANKFNGEIIAADSRTLYKGMDIGTAKPSQKDQETVPHWGIDLIEPGQAFSAAQFKDYAQTKIEEIKGRGKLPILVGGTGLYIDGVLFDLPFLKSSRLRRFIYSSWSVEKLQKIIQQRDWPLPENRHNKRHLVAAMERRGRIGSSKKEISLDIIIIGLMPKDESLRQKINERAELMFSSGIINETKALLEKYGSKKLDRTGGIAYKFSALAARGEISEPEAKELIQQAEWQYARRQKTWFRRNKFIQWYENNQIAFTSVSRLLNK